MTTDDIGEVRMVYQAMGFRTDTGEPEEILNVATVQEGKQWIQIMCHDGACHMLNSACYDRILLLPAGVVGRTQ